MIERIVSNLKVLLCMSGAESCFDRMHSQSEMSKHALRDTQGDLHFDRIGIGNNTEDTISDDSNDYRASNVHCVLLERDQGIPEEEPDKATT